MLDPARWPLAAEYLRSLPSGLDSFPECEARNEAYGGARERVKQEGDPGPLPEPVRRYFEEEDERKWIPEVIGMTLQMMMFDLEGEEAGVRWFYDDAARIFKGPILRTLMRLMSPTLVVMGAASRWGALRRGTQLSTEPTRRDGDRNRAIARLSYPAGLYPELFLRGLCESFRAALDGARGTEVRVVLTENDSGSAAYEVTWAR